MRPSRDDFVRIVRLSLPVAGVQLGLMAMGLLDTLMVGRVSAVDLGAVALGNILLMVAIVFGMGTLMALDPLVAQAVGAGDTEARARAVQRGLILAGVLGVVTSLVLLPAAPILSLARQPEEVIPIAAGYALYSIPGIIPFFAFVVFRQTLQAMGRVAPILWVALLANLVNFVLNWIFIWGNLGVPALGAVGSAIASSLARGFMAAALLAVAWPLLKSAVSPVRPGIFRIAPLARMLRLGAPIGFQFQLEFGAFAAIGLGMGLLGTVPLAGHQVAVNLAAFAFMIPVGISAAVAVRVGQAVGAERPERARGAAGAALLLGVGLMCGTAAIFLGWPDLLGRAFSSDPEVVAIVALLLPVAGIFQIVDGLQAVASGVLRGVGDTRAPMLANLVGFWVLGIPFGFVLAFPFDLGAVGLWWGLAGGLTIVAGILVMRVQRRLGRELRRLEIEE